MELSPDEAVAYLRKADISPVRLQEGINLVTFDGLPLGWIKRIGARSNNMYPKELRIVNL
ncbi:MAG: methyltransferase RsmF C-terminal domain-like protein [Alistipes indistinctus]